MNQLRKSDQSKDSDPDSIDYQAHFGKFSDDPYMDNQDIKNQTLNDGENPGKSSWVIL